MTDAPPPDGGLRPSGTDAEKLRSVYYFHKEGLAVIRPGRRILVRAPFQGTYVDFSAQANAYEHFVQAHYRQ